MKPLVLLVHGYNVTDPEQTVGQLRTFFEVQGCPTIIVDYGHTGLLATRRQNPKIAKRLAYLAKASKTANPERPIVVVGHSNGCAIIHIAATSHGAELDTVVYINPALEKHLAPGPRVKRCHVWHSPSDSPVKWAKRLSKVIPKRWFDARPWGEMGAVGYVGDDGRVQNFDKENNFLLSSKEHSDVFHWRLLPYFGELIAVRAVENL